MKRLILSFIFATLCGISAFAANNYDFSAVCSSGQTLYYIITSAYPPYTVTVISQNPHSPYYSSYPTGNLIIPSSVTYYGITFSVTALANEAFFGCSGLTTVTIPNSVTSIGNRAFGYCRGLTTVNFNATNCTSMGSSVWENSPFTTLNIGENVTSIPENAFSGCSGLTSVTIPNSVTSIGNSAFSGCNGLIEITIPNSVTSIGNSAFSGCSGLTSVTIGNSVTSIGNSAFSGCRLLTSLSIPNSVTSIGNSAFSGCSGLTSVIIPTSVTSIGSAAFSGCGGIVDMTIPFAGSSRTSTTASSSTLFGYVFGTSSYTGGTAVSQYYSSSSSNNKTYYIPSSLRSVTVTGGNLNYGAFYGCSMLTSVTIGNSVTSIGERAFYNCNGLTSLYIGNNVTSIGNSACSGCSSLNVVNFNATNCTTMGSSVWSGCSSLSTLNIGENVTNIPANAFSGCSGLTTVNFNATNCTTMGSSVWSGCSSLSTLNIGENVTNIPANAFSGCSGLTSVTIGNSVRGIGTYAFSDCSSISTVNFNATNCTSMATSSTDAVFKNCNTYATINIGDGVTKIPSYAFIGLRGNGALIIPSSVTSIGSYAFNDCSGLTSVFIPSSVTSIGRFAFINCSGLVDITIPFVGLSVESPSTFSEVFGSSQRNINVIITGGDSIPERAFYTCGGLKSVTIPNSVTRIGDNAFNSCYSLQSVIIPNSVTSIGHYAFSYCGAMTSVTIGNSVASIGGYAFYNCHGLANVYVNSATPPRLLNGSNFNANSNTVIWVPCGSAETYGRATYWRNLSDIRERSEKAPIVSSANGLYGTASIIQQPNCTEGIAIIEATPNEHYNFVQWSDGNTDNPRTISIGTLADSVGTGTGSSRVVPFYSSYSYSFVEQIYTAEEIGTSMPIYINSISFYHKSTLSSIEQTNDIVLYMKNVNRSSFADNSDYETVDDTNIVYSGSWPIPVEEGWCTIYLSAPFYYDGTSNLLVAMDENTSRHVDTYFAYTSMPNSVWASYNYYEDIDPYNIGTVNTITYNYRANAKFGITVEFVAEFAPDQYAISVESANELMGTVSGSNTYDYGTMIHISATANEHYHFVQWNDENTDNPRTITVTGDSTFTALFAINQYTITINSADETMGTVSEGGTYDYGTEIQISAAPAEHYHFVSWNDGNTENPRTITVALDANYTASFAIDRFTVTVESADTEMGTVSESGTYDYGDEIQISATANEHYHFVEWQDGNTENPRTIIVTEDATYTASFAIDRFTVTVESADAEMGTVSESGTYDYGTEIQISATPAEGYGFVAWNDGNTDNPRIVIVTEDTTYTAIFGVLRTITVVSADETMGTVQGTGEYVEGATAQITAIPNEHYHFVHWIVEENPTREIITDNPLTITVTGNVTYRAEFAIDRHTITVESDDETMGTVNGSNTYDYGTEIQISATATDHYHFLQWNDGNTDNPRTITVTEDATYRAEFAIDRFTITVESADEAMGIVSESNTYDYGTEIQISATAREHYHFVQWNDTNTDNPRTITVTEDATYRASFAIDRFTITVESADEAMGTVSEGGTYDYGSEIQISASAREGYQFVSWGDGNTDNPRTITVVTDATYIASFMSVVGIDESALTEIALYPNPASDILNITSSETISEIEIVNTLGQVVKRIEVNSDNAVCDVEELKAGVYVVRIRTASATLSQRKFIKE